MGPDQQSSFEEVKILLSSEPVLALYDREKDTVVSADSSAYGLGALLLQYQENGSLHPVAYASRVLSDAEKRYAQIEKEALATTWACERFHDYLAGKLFHIETDHKPLVSLLGTKDLSELPARIQRFRIRLMRYLYTIDYVPGKNLHAADALSRIQINKPEKNDDELVKESESYLCSVLKQIPMSESRLEDVRTETKTDEVCQKISMYVKDGWPEKYEVNHLVRPYWEAKEDITEENGILLHGTRLLIPSKLCLDILDRIHEGHMGIQKCHDRARMSVWWPGMGRQIKEMVESCPTCAVFRKQQIEPLMPTEMPERPFQKVGVDLFEFNKQTYLLIVDYFSRFPIVKLLSSTTSMDVINHLKSAFAQHGIPQILLSDNGPQFSASQFKDFTKSWNINHITSSPRFAQSNGEVERSVQTVKNLLKKSGDPYLALLAYRTTPLVNGEAPCQLLMGRMLRTTIPVHPSC